MVLYLDRMCQCGLHAVLWLHIDTLMLRLAAEPRSIVWLLFLSECPSGTIWCGTGGFQEQGQCFLYWPKLLYSYYTLSTIFTLLFFQFIGWYYGAGVFGLIGCTSLSLSFAVPTSFNNNNNNYYNKCARVSPLSQNNKCARVILFCVKLISGLFPYCSLVF